MPSLIVNIFYSQMSFPILTQSRNLVPCVALPNGLNFTSMCSQILEINSASQRSAADVAKRCGEAMLSHRLSLEGSGTHSYIMLRPF
jgi:hypothetical protein